MIVMNYRSLYVVLAILPLALQQRGPLCKFGGCSVDPVGCHSAVWSVNGSGSALHVELEGKVDGGWLAIGFSKSGSIADSDIITGYLKDGQAVVQDRFSTTNGTTPVDSDQTVLLGSSGMTGSGFTQITFTRSLTSSDQQDVSLDAPIYILFLRGSSLNDTFIEETWMNVTSEPVNVSECIFCQVHPCQNDGSCEIVNGVHQCVCSPQFAGPSCETSLVNCDPSTNCSGHGTCNPSFDPSKPVNDSNSVCLCVEDYSGASCDIKQCVNETIDCNNNGICNPFRDRSKPPGVSSNFLCLCLGYTGLTCDTFIDLCASGVPMGREVCGSASEPCNPKVGHFQCGMPCESNPCMNGGTCSAKRSAVGFDCTCPDGFTGVVCDIPIVLTPSSTSSVRISSSTAPTASRSQDIVSSSSSLTVVEIQSTVSAILSRSVMPTTVTTVVSQMPSSVKSVMVSSKLTVGLSSKHTSALPSVSAMSSILTSVGTVQTSKAVVVTSLGTTAATTTEGMTSKPLSTATVALSARQSEESPSTTTTLPSASPSTLTSLLVASSFGTAPSSGTVPSSAVAPSSSTPPSSAVAPSSSTPPSSAVAPSSSLPSSAVILSSSTAPSSVITPSSSVPLVASPSLLLSSLAVSSSATAPISSTAPSTAIVRSSSSVPPSTVAPPSATARSSSSAQSSSTARSSALSPSSAVAPSTAATSPVTVVGPVSSTSLGSSPVLSTRASSALTLYVPVSQTLSHSSVLSSSTHVVVPSASPSASPTPLTDIPTTVPSVTAPSGNITLTPPTGEALASSNDTSMIVGIVIGCVVIIAVIIILIFIIVLRVQSKEGAYSPSQQETKGGARVELGNVLLPPERERLI